MSLSPVTVELTASISEFKAKMREAGQEVEHLSSKGGKTFEKFAAVGKATLLGLGGVAVAAGGFALEMADKYEASHAKLEAALKGAGTSFDAYKGQIEAAQKGMERLGFTNADTQAALAQFTVSLGSPKEGLKQLGLAADLARFKNIPLADASLAVAKAMEGQLRPLKALGIDLPFAAAGALKLKNAHAALGKAQGKLTDLLHLHSGAMQASSKFHAQYIKAQDAVKAATEKLNAVQKTSGGILDALHKKLGGQAASAADTFGGKILALKVKAEDLGAKLGLVLIPIIMQVVSATQQVVAWFQKHKTITEALAGVVGGVMVAAIGAYLYGVVAAAAASVVSFATMLAGAVAWAAGMLVAGATALLPFLPIIAACALVAFAAYELYKHWNTVWGFIKNVTLAAWHFIDRSVIRPIEQAFKWVVAQIKSHWQLILAILTGPIGLAVLFIKDHFNAIKNAVMSAFSWVQDHWKGILSILTGPIGAAVIYIVTHWDKIVSTVQAIPGRIASVAANMWNGIKNSFRSAINFIIDGWNSLSFGIPSVSIPGLGKIGGGSVGVMRVPHLAQGGIVPATPGGRLVLVGEAGRDEAVIPLSHGAGRVGGGVGGGGGGDVYNINVNGALDATAVGKQVVAAIRQYKQQSGGGKLGIA